MLLLYGLFTQVGAFYRHKNVCAASTCAVLAQALLCSNSRAPLPATPYMLQAANSLLSLPTLLVIAVMAIGSIALMPERGRTGSSDIIGPGYCRPAGTECDVYFDGNFRGATASCPFEIHSVCGLSFDACRERCGHLDGCKGIAYSPTDSMNHCAVEDGKYVYRSDFKVLSLDGTQPSGIPKCVAYVGNDAIVRSEEIGTVLGDFTCYS